MAAVDMLEEDECYLYAILTDPSGLDLAELVWTEPENDDYCWRAWAFQWKWFRDTSPMQIDQGSRSIGKSLSIKLRAFAFPFLHPGQEMAITAPEGNHLSAITGLIETTYMNNRLGREMLPRGRNQGITHRPFEMNFINGSRIMGRIPQRDGRGVKGIHPLWLELDEGQDYPGPGWVEVIETLKRGSEGAVWRAHGVTRGVRDHFYKFTQPGSGWAIHHIPAMWRPTWSAAEREEKIESYGSRDHPDYRRNVLGLHGDATNPLFVLHRLMRCVDLDDTSDYNTKVFQYFKMSDEKVADRGAGEIVPLLDFNAAHRVLFKKFWAGMDVGYTNHPSEILIFGEERAKPKDPATLRLVCRIHMDRISHGQQVAAITHVMDFYSCSLSLDKTGLGLPLFQDIQERRPDLVNEIKGYNFSSKILVDFDQSVEVDEFYGDPVKEAAIERNVLEYSSDKLREFVDAERIKLPWDRDLIGEFQGQTWSYDKSGMDMYGRRKSYNKGSFHALDACKMAVLGFVQHGIEEFTRKEAFEGSTDVFFYQ